MIVLSLDTALQRCSVAILRDDKPISVLIEDRERGHAERLAPMTAQAFEDAGVAPRDLDRVGVVVGPGGFTGVRVALSFARAMGLALGVDVIGVNSLSALAAGAGDEADPVAGFVDARRNQVYAGVYRRHEEVVAPFVASPAAAAARIRNAVAGPVQLVGSGVPLIEAPPGWRKAKADSQIDPVIVARLAAASATTGKPPAPLYLRAPDAAPAAR